MNSDENKGTVSSSSLVRGEFRIAPREILQDKFEFSIKESTVLSTYGFYIDKIAKLANLLPTSKEKEKYSEQLSDILGYFEKFKKVDTSKVEPTFNVTGQSNVMREDETALCLSQEEALSNASKKKDSIFETKGVFEEG